MARTSQSSVRVTGAYHDQLAAKKASILRELVDPLVAAPDDAAQHIVHSDDAGHGSVFAFGPAAKHDAPDTAHAAADRTGKRLRELSDEVGRIASALARLSVDPGPSVRSAKDGPVADAAVSADIVRAVIRARRLRATYFFEGLFADPAWDMLLELLQAEISQFRVPVSSLCDAAAVPATTALRWLKAMVQQGLFIRRADPHDGRRVFVELAPKTSRALRRYFAEVAGAAVI